MAQSIIERDREFYCGEQDRLIEELRRSPVGEESEILGKIKAVKEVIAALEGYYMALKYGAVPFISDRPGDQAAEYAAEAGVSYERALVACNMD